MRIPAALFALTLATPALAQQAAPPAPPVPQAARPGQPTPTIIVEPVAMMIAAFDADGDARITRAEFDTGLRHSYDAIARGGADIGFIAYSDWAERWLGSRNALPDPFEVDHDGNNRISFDELAQRFALFFTRFDVDRDGALVRSELVTTRMPFLQGDRRGRRGGDDSPPRR